MVKLFLRIVVCWLIQTECQAQILDTYNYESVALVIGVDSSKFVPRMQSRARIFPDIVFLASKEVRQELDTTDQQNSQLDELGKKCDKLSFELQIKRQKGELKSDELKRVFNDLVDEVETILLPHQKTRLNEVKLRITLRFRGIDSFLAQVAPTYGIKLSERERAEVNRLLKEIVEKEVPETEKVCSQKVTEMLRATLTPEQFEKVEPLVTNRFRNGGLDALLCQLSLAQVDKEFTSMLDRFRNSPWYEFDSSGTWNAKPTYLNDTSAIVAVLELILNADSKQLEQLDLFLDENEINEIRNAVQEFRDRTNSITQQVQDILQKEGQKAFVESLRKLNQERDDLLKNAYDSVLFSGRRELVEDRLLSQLLICRYGLVDEIVNGHLGKKLKINEKQRTQLKSGSKELLGQISELVLKLEESSFSKIGNGLSIENKNKLDSMLGKRLSHIQPSLLQFSLVEE